MVWFFARDGARVRLETSFDQTTGDYVLTIDWPGRAIETERYDDVDSFRARLATLEDQLASERWMQLASPQFLSQGWRGPFTH